jgi:hypothetical protein
MVLKSSKKSRRPNKPHHYRIISKSAWKHFNSWYLENHGKGRTDKDLFEEYGSLHNIELKTLEKHVQRLSDTKPKAHGNCILKLIQEKMVVAILIACSLLNLALTPFKLFGIVKRLFRLPKKQRLDGWFRRFKKRNSKFITIRRADTITKKRSSKELLIEVPNFVKLYQHKLEELGLTEDDIMNLDETPLFSLSEISNKFVIDYAGKSKADRADSRDSACGCMLPIVTASGRTLFNVYIFPSKTHDDEFTSLNVPRFERASARLGTPPCYFICTKKGKVTDAVFVLIMETFVKEVIGENNKKWKLLLVDNLNSHLTLETVELLAKHKICLLPLPPNSTHFLQPLDNIIFANFKRKM